jgi:hypothetical protein
VKLPATFAVRCGLYNPGKGGARAKLAGPLDSTGRVKCGQVVVAKAEAGGASMRWEAEPVDREAAIRETRLNTAGKVVDFGPVATSGAFRLRHGPGAEWDLAPLPSSQPFKVELRLGQLGRQGVRARQVVAMDIKGQALGTVASEQAGETLRFAADGAAFRYVIQFDAGERKD